MALLRYLFFSWGIFFLTSCAGLPTAAFEKEHPLLEPISFFTGRTSSSGVIENRAGQPIQRVTTETIGRMQDGALVLEQELRFSDGKRQRRSWRIRRLDAHHYSATANDMIGEARGEAYGNAFHWSFRLALSPGNPFLNVRMSQWMYLQPDGRTLINHSSIRKAGLLIAQVTEQFRRENSRPR